MALEAGLIDSAERSRHDCRAVQSILFPLGVQDMPITVEAVYENGVLKLVQPLPLKEHEKVRVTIQSEARVVQQTYGIIGWQGDHETLERLLAEAEELP